MDPRPDQSRSSRTQLDLILDWKDATDDSGWLRLGKARQASGRRRPLMVATSGHACRLGFKLGLHNISLALPENHLEARKAMVRLWQSHIL